MNADTLRLLFVFVASSAIMADSADLASIERDLAEAFSQKSLPTVEAVVARAIDALGEKTGVPETPDEYRKVPDGATLLQPDEIQPGLAPLRERLEKLIWWKGEVDPTRMTAPLRAPASVLVGTMATARAGLGDVAWAESTAEQAARFLLHAQSEAEAGLFPFPAARDTSDARAMQVGSRMLAEFERQGRLDEAVRNGWAIEDFGDGGLQFDNGVCGIAMLEWFSFSEEKEALASAIRAGEWAINRPLATNWNYNAFSVDLLAALHEVTGEDRFLDSAVEKARVGVLPGQLCEGPHAGRWFDPHNARPPYHYIMMQALTRLADVMPKDHPHREEIIESLRLGLTKRNTEMVERGVMDKESALECLLLVVTVFADDPEFVAETRSQEALDQILLLCSAEYRGGKAPLGPGGWGLMLEHLASRDESVVLP